ncbi:putative iron transport multicopper oxidase FET3 [Echria macrotheca]|uniref:Iron transport multicopper oxidase FET3 n=1 Tax=Echria macrotheca TaxID=438768 RepID=A0AAJ0B5X1_9PEZI|nr:putative iron transport multicopper oxidase FET3 [Echria macrotheca]
MLLPRVQTLGLLSLASLTRAATVTYNFDVTWVWAAPDGFGRPVIGINNQWPCPTIEANVGDTIVVNVNNKLGNQTTGMHWHGINQISTEDMDGPAGVAQCPVPPGSSIQYQFVADSAGTYWYHSHNLGQYPDGLRGPLIIHDPNDPNKGKYDEEVVITVSDWYHEQSLDLARDMLVPTNTHFQPPIPSNILVNDGRGAYIAVEQGKKYRVRLINMSALAGLIIHFQGQSMNVIMNDASAINQISANQLKAAAAQRYDFIIEATSSDTNIPFLIALDTNRDIHNPSLDPLEWPLNYTGYLVVDSSKPTDAEDIVYFFNPDDDSKWTSADGTAPITNTAGGYDKLVELDFNFCLDENGYPRACFNNITYIDQQVPTLYTAATTGTDNTNPIVYGQVNPHILGENDIVQIVVNNFDDAAHPFHLHGHQFQVLERGLSQAGVWPGDSAAYSSAPPRRDTVVVNGGSFAVLRFKATNPGVWLFHCHIEWHVEMGLTATLIEAPNKLRGMSFPSDHIAACEAGGTPYSGNAAGNTVNFTDTSGYATVPPTEYNGCMYVAPEATAR